MYKQLTRPYLSSRDAQDSKNEENEESEEHRDVTLELETELYIVLTRSAVLMGISPQADTWVVDGTRIDRGPNVILLVLIPLLPPMRAANMRKIKPMADNRQKSLNTTGMSVKPLGTITLHVRFDSLKYSVMLNSILGLTALISLRRYLDSMGLN